MNIYVHIHVCVFMNLSHNVYFDFVGERLPNCGAKPASGLTLVLLFIIICVIVIALSSSFSQVFYTSSFGSGSWFISFFVWFGLVGCQTTVLCGG